MNKKKSKVNKRKKINVSNKNNNKLMGIKEFDKTNILISLLVVIFIVWGLLLLVRYRNYYYINKKINEIDTINDGIKLLNDGYTEIEDIVKKIDKLNDDNDNLNKNIDSITKEIEDLDNKISKYSK